MGTIVAAAKTKEQQLWQASKGDNKSLLSTQFDTQFDTQFTQCTQYTQLLSLLSY